MLGPGRQEGQAIDVVEMFPVVRDQRDVQGHGRGRNPRVGNFNGMPGRESLLTDGSPALT